MNVPVLSYFGIGREPLTLHTNGAVASPITGAGSAGCRECGFTRSVKNSRGQLRAGLLPDA